MASQERLVLIRHFYPWHLSSVVTFKNKLLQLHHGIFHTHWHNKGHCIRNAKYTDKTKCLVRKKRHTQLRNYWTFTFNSNSTAFLTKGTTVHGSKNSKSSRTYNVDIRICPNSLIRLKQSKDDDRVNQIGTIRQPAQWNPESSRQEFIHQAFKRRREQIKSSIATLMQHRPVMNISSIR